MLGGILILIVLQGLLLLPAGFDALERRQVLPKVDTVSMGVPYYHYGQFVRLVRLDV